MNGFRLLESVFFEDEITEHNFNQYVTPLVGAWYEGGEVLGQVHAYRIDAGRILEEGGHDLFRKILEQDHELLSLYYMLTDEGTKGYDFWYPSSTAKPHLEGFESPDWQFTYVKLLRVDNGFRGRKLGHKIMSEFEKSLPGTSTVLLHSCPLEGPARPENILGLNRYYESMGFVEVEKDSDLLGKATAGFSKEARADTCLSA